MTNAPDECARATTTPFLIMAQEMEPVPFSCAETVGKSGGEGTV